MRAHPSPRSLRLAALSWLALALAACSPQGPAPARRDAEVALGRKIFLDARLSSDGTISCSNCHDPAHAFADGRALPVGVGHRIGTRNAPSLANVHAETTFFWDGRAGTLEAVVTQPFTNPAEMGLADSRDLLRRLEKDSAYRTAFATAFPGRKVPQLDQVASALTGYIRSQPAARSRFDDFVSSGGKSGLDSDEQYGFALFKGKAGCSDCHSIAGERPALTDQAFHHTGIGYQQIAGRIAPLLVRLDQLQAQDRPLGIAILGERDISELGRFAITRQPGDLGAFRTPSLRNVALTAPYMHDGSIPDLATAIRQEIYYRSLERGRPIELTVREQDELRAFLETLSDR